MEEISTLLEQLEEDKMRDYVFARSETVNDSDAYKKSGVGKQNFYRWPAETRKHLNALAVKIRIDHSFRARAILSEHLAEAAEVKISGLKHRDDRIKQSVATEILDRQLGKPKQAVEHSGEVGSTITVVEVIKANED